MVKEKEKVKTVLDETLSCAECGRMAWPCWLCYSEVTHTNAVWCMTCYPHAATRGEFTPRKEGTT